jgi:hypothetical protein
MSSEFESLDAFDAKGGDSPKQLPNATGVLVLGILSIVMCFLYGIIGIILGIIALVLHKKDKELYASNPIAYEASFKNSNAGKVCAIIGLSLSALYLLFILFVVVGVLSQGAFYR